MDNPQPYFPSSSISPTYHRQAALHDHAAYTQHEITENVRPHVEEEEEDEEEDEDEAVEPGRCRNACKLANKSKRIYVRWKK
jgi:hypothetical protein